MVDINKVDWNTIKLTVVMPSYNRSEYISQAINSVLSQRVSFKLLLVITDDASTDDTRKIVSEYEHKYPDIILAMYSDKNVGLLANDLKVFKFMKSEYFCVLDPDDYWVDEHFLEKAVCFLERNKDFVCYGANSRILKEGKLLDGYYVKTDIKEAWVNGIEDYLCGRTYIPHTTAGVYRNAIFKNGIPDIIKNSVGTLAEASFRGDLDRYVIHLKYGKAKFVNEWAGVYRIHDKGICQGGTMFHWKLMNARCELDYSRFYNDQFEDKFLDRARVRFKEVCVELYKASVFNEFFKMDDYDAGNFAYLMNRLCNNEKNGAIKTEFTRFKEQQRKVIKLLSNKNKFVLWGTGKSAESLMEKYYIEKDNIIVFIDNDESRIGKSFCGKMIAAPKEIKKIKPELVVIASKFYNEIMKQIEAESLCEYRNIVNLFWFDVFSNEL